MEDDVIPDVIALGACVSAWHVARGSACYDECDRRRRVLAREMTLVIPVRSGGAWQRVAHRLGPKFLCLVDRGTVDLLVLSVF